jgi:TolB protein
VKLRPVLIAFVVVSPFLRAEVRAQRMLAFERGEDVWIAKLDGSGAKKIAKGSAPDLSPDGQLLVFNTDEPSKDVPIRRIAIANVQTGKVKVVEGLPSNNCIRPVWSPDGKELLFQIITDGWHLARVAADGSGFRFVKKAEPKGHSFWSACWAPDGKSFYCQDLDRLLQCDLRGEVLKSWDLLKLFPEAGFSSGARLDVAPDGRTMLLDADLNEEIVRKGWDGPPPSLWKLDLETSKVTRLSAKGSFDWEPRWLSAEEYLFISMPGGPSTISVYRQKLDGSGRKLVIKNARMPSAGREH